MIKIDLHLHTISTEKDNEFTFDMETLQKYIKMNELSAVAITNHNKFDSTQYFNIVENIKGCIVFPGIEVDYNNGHILIISENTESAVAEFQKKCDELSQIFTDNPEKKYVTKNELLRIFVNFEPYLIVPHYKKDKRDLTFDQIKDLDNSIKWGEVGNVKKFIRTKKNVNDLTPLIFSDFRVEKFDDDSAKKSKRFESFPNRHTYIDLKSDDITIKKMKICFSSKDRVSLNKEKDDSYFSIMENRVKIVDGLNVIIGSRSSGKTYLLDSINASSVTKMAKDVKYIQQFQITNESNKDNILEILASNVEIFVNDYTKKMNDYITNISNLNPDELEQKLAKYTRNLLKNSSEESMKDIFSKCKLFDEPDNMDINTNDTKNLIEAIYKILNNEKHELLISKYIDLSRIKLLIEELMKIYKYELLENKVIDKTNIWSALISEKLQGESSVTPILSYDMNMHFKIMKQISMFEDFIKNFTIQKEIYNDNFYDKFFQTTYLTKNQNIDDLYKSTKYSPQKDIKKSVSESNKLVNEPFNYLKDIVDNKDIDKSKFDLYKIFFRTENNVINLQGTDLSGGQRAELNLLNHLKEAKKSDILLIDEIEPSFDNIYINQDLLTIIREIAKESIVVLSTHNNSIGVLLEPDNLIYTDYYYDEKNKKTVYKQYFGHYSSDKLLSVDGIEKSTKQIYIDMMEGGSHPYKKRGSIYESFDN